MSDYYNPIPLPTDLVSKTDADPVLRAVSVQLRGPYTVQDGGANPLPSVASMQGISGGLFCGVADLGGCGTDGTPGFGYAVWTGAEWRRVNRGLQVTMDPAASITLDYWKSPTRVKLTGSTLTPTRLLLANSRVGHIVSCYKPGIISATLQAFSVNLVGNSAGTDLSVLGNGLGVLEVISASAIQAVQT